MKNVPIRGKMIIGGVIFLAILIVVWQATRVLDKESAIGEAMYDEIMLSTELTADILPPPEYIIESYAYALEYIVSTDTEEMSKAVNNVNALRETFETRNRYWRSAAPDFGNLRDVFVSDAYNAGIEFFEAFNKQVVPAKQSGDKDTLDAAKDTMKAAYEKHRVAIDKTVKLSENYLAMTLTKSEQSENDANNMTIILLVVAVLIVVLFFIYLTVSISRPLRYASNVINRIADGDINQQIDPKYLTKDEAGSVLASTSRVLSDLLQFSSLNAAILRMETKFREEGDIDARVDENEFNGAYREVAAGLNRIVGNAMKEQSDMLVCLSQISGGDFAAQAPILPGKKAVITDSINGIRSNIMRVSNEIKTLAIDAGNGNLSVRATTSGFTGGWSEILNALNSLMASFNAAIDDMLKALTEISKGNFTYRVANEYKGDFNRIKETVNGTAEDVNSYISEVAEILGFMADGDLTVKITRDYVGQFEAIKDSINKITAALNQTLGEISNASEQVLIGSKQMSQSAMMLAQGATEQAGAVTELTASVDDIGHQTKDSSDNSRKASDLAVTSKSNAETGNSDMKLLLDAMDGISNASSKISDIIKTIEAIASQTNLLALNAAVEAARAGEHGKGFNVVAGEVRQLAQKSAEAANETNALIAETVVRVKEGSKRAENTAHSLSRIVENVSDMTSIIDKIYKSSAMQEASIGEVSVGLNQISAVVQSNSATSEQSAAASEELNSQSETLKQMISFFRLK